MKHIHEWTTRYIKFGSRHQYDAASGMQCKCGAELSQYQIEHIINVAEMAAEGGAGAQIKKSIEKMKNEFSTYEK